MADFQSHLDELDALGVTVVGGSVDTLEDATKTVKRHDLTFPLAYGMDARHFSAETGAFYDEDRGIIHATGFILRPGGSIASATYSTGPVGRFNAKDAMGLIQYLQKHA